METKFTSEKLELTKRPHPDPNGENQNQTNIEKEIKTKGKLRHSTTRVILGELNIETRIEGGNIEETDRQQNETSLKKVKEHTGLQKKTLDEEKDLKELQFEDTFFMEIKEGQEEFVKSRTMIMNQIGKYSL